MSPPTDNADADGNEREADRQRDRDVRVVDRRWWTRTGDDEGDGPVARKPTYVEELEQQLADARARIQDLTAGHRQSLDEFEQVKVRLRRDVAREVERGRRAVLTELLEVLDNLDRAAAAFRETADDTVTPAVDQLARGVELVRSQFVAKLEGLGVSRVAALGEPFDATRHEAVSLTPVSEPTHDGTVVAVVREGYAMGAELLRPASVVVGRLAE